MSRILNAFVQKQKKTFYTDKNGVEKGEKTEIDWTIEKNETFDLCSCLPFDSFNCCSLGWRNFLSLSLSLSLSFVCLVSPFTYLQGMNAISGCFLFCMSEMDAYYAFSNFITEKTPLYWVSSHIGANAGCKLVDAVLETVDPVLFAHLNAKTPGAYVYAFPCVSGFCSAIRPLSEVLKLWDFLLACGPHFNVGENMTIGRGKAIESENIWHLEYMTNLCRLCVSLDCCWLVVWRSYVSPLKLC